MEQGDVILIVACVIILIIIIYLYKYIIKQFEAARNLYKIYCLPLTDEQFKNILDEYLDYFIEEKSLKLFIDNQCNTPYRYNYFSSLPLPLNILEEFVDYPLNWEYISSNPNVTVEFVEKHPYKYWCRQTLQQKQSIDQNDAFLVTI